MRRLATLLLLALALPARAGTAISGFTDSLFVGGLDQPTAIAFLPDGRMLVTEKTGKLELAAAGVTKTLITLGVCTDSEMGLLGVAVDPGYTANGFVYLYRTMPGAGGCGTSTGRFNEVVRVTVGAGDTVDPASLTVLLSGIRTDGGNHDGGGLRIGPDGKLYVGAGDAGIGDNQGGPGSSTNPYAQDLAELQGKLLRLNLDGAIPTDNPFFNQAGKRGEIFAYGVRNPFRFSFDPVSQALWLADVGDLTVEELDIVTSGGNYAWPHCEGTLPAGCEQAGDIDPIFTYPHSGGTSLGTCMIGGAFSTGTFGGLGDQYFFGDCTSDVVYHAPVNGARTALAAAPATFVTGAALPSDFAFGPDGALYYPAVAGGEVRRVAPVQGDDTGFVPPTAAVKKCEDGIAKNVSKLAQCIIKCHLKQVDFAFKGKPFDEEACEKADPTRSCRVKFTAAGQRLIAAGLCPSCLDAAHQAALADLTESTLDGQNGQVYCASPGGAFIDP